MSFSQLGLSAPLLKALEQVGYKTPSPIQEKSIPPLLEGRDLLGCAQTGTGKTAAFALPLLQLLSKKPTSGRLRPIRALVLTPTRELAAQIQENFRDYGRNLRQRSVVIFGGVGQRAQVDALSRGVDILVATPGRLLDLVGQGHIKLGKLEYFVLDEADRMLDMGFIHDIRRVIKLLPEKRQTLFFSATMPQEIQGLADSLLTDPVKVTVNPVSSTVDIIRQEVAFTQKADKRELLLWLLRGHNISSALVFTRTKHLADRVAKFLKQKGVSAEALHGDKSQGARLQALGAFKSGKCRVLVATDIAARGIDVDGISHVFNFDLPDMPETYVHRIGRTGRAGREGIAVSFCTPEDMPLLVGIQKLIKKELIPLEGHPFAVDVTVPVPASKQGGRTHSSSGKPQRQKREHSHKKPAPKQGQKPLAEEIKAESELPPIPKGGFSSEMRLPGRVAAKGGTARANKGGQSAPKSERTHKPDNNTPSTPKPPRAGGGHSGGKRRGKKGGPREPVWVPLNNQPIVTRPQTRSAFPEPEKGKNN